MLYKRPEHLSYSEMCIYIDTHVYEKDCDQQLVFEYLYHIILMLARKHKLFEKFSDYEDFTLWSATELFNRLFDKRQYVENAKLKKIKSILNYAKHVLYPLSCKYRAHAFNSTPINTCEEIQPYNGEIITSDYINIDIEIYLQQLPATIKSIVKQHLFYKNYQEYKNIIISCYLTLLDQITLPNNESIKSIEDNTEYLWKRFREESQNKVILYNLSNSHVNQIKFLINKIKKQLLKDIKTVACIHNEPQELISYMLFEHAKDIIGQEE